MTAGPDTATVEGYLEYGLGPTGTTSCMSARTPSLAFLDEADHRIQQEHQATAAAPPPIG